MSNNSDALTVWHVSGDCGQHTDTSRFYAHNIKENAKSKVRASKEIISSIWNYLWYQGFAYTLQMNIVKRIPAVHVKCSCIYDPCFLQQSAI